MRRDMSKQHRQTVIPHMEKRSKMYVTFSNRLKGIFRKAAELSEISSCEVAILVLSEGGRPYLFASGPGNPSFHQILESYTSGSFYCPAKQVIYNRHNDKLCLSSSRRRNSLFKTSGELSKLCHCEIAILLLPPTLGRRPYCFSAGLHCPSFDDIVHAYLRSPTTSTLHSFTAPTPPITYTPSSTNSMCQGASSSSIDILSIDDNVISFSDLKIV